MNDKIDGWATRRRGQISIVMPVYNGADYIDDAVRSCIAQTWDDWELIIVDDASTDETPERIRYWESIEPRIRSTRHEHNRGLPHSLNTGIANMTGEFYTWLSADDEFRSHALITMAKFLLDRPNVDVVYTDYSEVDGEGNHLRRITVEDPDLLGVGNPTGVCHLRRSSIFDTVGLYAEDLFLAEDLDMWIRMHAACELRALHEDLFRYRQHDGSLTSLEQRRVYLVHEQVLDRHVDRMDWLDADGRAWAYIRLARSALQRRDVAAFARLSGKSLRYSPTFIPRKTVARLGAAARRPSGATDAIDEIDPTDDRRLLWVYTEPLDGTLDAATWIETANGLTNFGWDVTLAAVGDGGHGSIGRAKTWLTPRPSGYGVGQAAFHAKVAKLLWQAERTPNVVLFHEMSALWLRPLKAALQVAGKPVPQFVLDSRTLHMTDRRNESFKDRVRRRLYDGVRERAATWTDGQTAITERMAEVLELEEPELWGVWPSGVTVEPFNDAAGTRHYPTADEPVRLIYIGSLAHERNLVSVVAAVEQANSRGMRFHLTIIGAGTGMADLENLARVHDFLDVRDPVPHDEIPAHLALAHVGVLAFPDNVTFRVSSPIKLFEYLASGLTILATKIVCHTDVIDDSDVVEWIDPTATADAVTDALTRLWARRENLGTNSWSAMANADHWTWNRSAHQLHEALVKGTARARGDLVNGRADGGTP